jgi:uncharacterized protein YjbJ (UPF0337 family)
MADNTHRDDSVREEVSAFGQRVTGATKDAAGAITGNRSLEREGERENAEGRARQAQNDVVGDTSLDADRRGGTGTVSEELSATAQRVKGGAKDATGSLLGLNRMEHEGELENATGRARQAANDVTGTTPTYGSSSDRLVTGIYDSPEHAGRAYQDLTSRHGYAANDVSVVMSDETRARHFGDATPGREFEGAHEGGSKAAEGAGIGGAAGMGVGAALGALLAAATSIAIPGLGLIVAGPIAGAIAGAGAGGAAGTLMGALIGAGIPEDRAKAYDEGIRKGGIVLGTRARDEAHAAELERDFSTHGGRDILR